MNSLTLIIYAMDVLNELQGSLILFTIIGVLSNALLAIAVCDCGWSKNLFWLNLIFVFTTALIVVIPSKSTMKMMVASEVAESGIEKLVEMSKDDQSIVFKGMKKLESLLEVIDSTATEGK